MRHPHLKRLQIQFLKYIAIGAVANSIGYGLYLLITWLGVGSILGMSMVYTSACIASFLGNKNWTFGDKSKNRRLLPRYLVIQSIGYLTNLFMLLVLYQSLGIPHQLVQLLAIAVVAIELFLLSKYYVFRAGATI